MTTSEGFIKDLGENTESLQSNNHREKESMNLNSSAVQRTSSILFGSSSSSASTQMPPPQSPGLLIGNSTTVISNISEQLDNNREISSQVNEGNSRHASSIGSSSNQGPRRNSTNQELEISVSNVITRHLDSERHREEALQGMLRQESESNIVYFSSQESGTEEGNIFSKFSGKSEDIKVLTGFFLSEVKELFSVVEESLEQQGRGKKSVLEPIDIFFLLLVLLKHNETFSKMSVDYSVSDTVIETQLKKAIPKIRLGLEKQFISPIYKDEQMLKGIVFSSFPEIALVVDVTFQPRPKPSLIYQEAKKYFSGKHFRYGYKTETGHAPNGMLMFISPHSKGAKHDFSIFKENIGKYNLFLRKGNSSRTMADSGLLHTQFPNSWAGMVDKGYQGAQELGRYILPKKGSRLTTQERMLNENIAKSRIIIENYYGRMKKLFKIMTDVFRFEEDCYDDVIVICACLTNYNIAKNPLRKEDGDYQKAVLKCWRQEEEQRQEKRKASNQAYQLNKKRKYLAERDDAQRTLDEYLLEN